MTCNRTKEECTRNDCFIDTHLKQVCFHGHEVARLIAPEQEPPQHTVVGQGFHIKKKMSTEKFDEVLGNSLKAHGLIEPQPAPQLLPSENEYFKCPECNADIRFGLNAQTLEAFRQSKLFKDKPLPLAQSDQTLPEMYSAALGIIKDLQAEIQTLKDRIECYEKRGESAF